ncbi:MAG: sugar transferase [Actinomycetota bacterium]
MHGSRTAAAPQADRRHVEDRFIDLTRIEKSEKQPLERFKLWSFAAGVGISGAAAGILSLLLAYGARHGNPFCGPGFTTCGESLPYIALLPAAAGIRMALALRRRPWQHRRPRGFFEEVREAVSDAAVGSILLVLFTFFFRAGTEFQTFSYSRSVFFIDWLAATLLSIVVAVGAKATLDVLRSRGNNLKNVVLIGRGHKAAAFQETIEAHPELGYRLVGRVEADLDGSSEIDIQEYLLAIAEVHRLDEAILATDSLHSSQLYRLVGVAELVHVEIKAIPELFGLPPTKVANETLGHLPVLSLLKEPLPGGRRAVKRAIDILLGSLALFLITPVLIAAAVAVRLTSKGPIILRQERLGMDGRPFQMMKFRTMYVDSDPSIHRDYVRSLIEEPDIEASDELLKLQDDPRITPAGKLLRRLSIDELPQLINVLRGEMSLVGPRPALAFEVELYTELHRRRLEVRPGMTGLWQVKGRSRLSFTEMVSLDIQYMERWSPLQDLLILGRTIPAVLRRETS